MSINKNFATLLSLVTSKAAIASFKYIGKKDKSHQAHKYGSTMLYLGLSAIIFVPIFKIFYLIEPSFVVAS